MMQNFIPLALKLCEQDSFYSKYSSHICVCLCICIHIYIYTYIQTMVVNNGEVLNLSLKQKSLSSRESWET